MFGHLYLERSLILLGLLPIQKLGRHKAYVALMLFLNIIGTVYALFEVNTDRLIVSNFVSILLFICYRLVMAVCHLEMVFRRSQYAEFLRQAHRIRVMFQRDFSLPVALRDARHTNLRKYIFFLFVSVGGLIVYFILITLHPYNGFFRHVLPVLVVVRMRCLQTIVYIDYVAYYVAMLNLKLSAVLSCKVRRDFVMLDVNYRYIESFEYLRKLKALYEEIARFQALLNDSFGWSLVSVVTVVGLDIIFNTYWMFLALNNLYPPHYLFYTTTMMPTLSIVLASVMYTGEQCKRQCHLTVSSVHRLLCTTHHDREYLDLTHEFLMEIREQPIKINAKDYFAVDFNLLMQFVAAMVTYLVVLLQFST